MPRRMPAGRCSTPPCADPTARSCRTSRSTGSGERRYWLMTAWGSNRANERPELDWLRGQAARPGRLHHRRVVRGRAAGRAGPAAEADRVAAHARPTCRPCAYMSFREGTLAGDPARHRLANGLHRRAGLRADRAGGARATTLWEAVMAAGQPRHGMLPCRAGDRLSACGMRRVHRAASISWTA